MPTANRLRRHEQLCFPDDDEIKHCARHENGTKEVSPRGHVHRGMGETGYVGMNGQ